MAFGFQCLPQGKLVIVLMYHGQPHLVVYSYSESGSGPPVPYKVKNEKQGLSMVTSTRDLRGVLHQREVNFFKPAVKIATCHVV